MTMTTIGRRIATIWAALKCLLSRKRRLSTQWYANGAREELLTDGRKRITYNTGDVVVMDRGVVVEIKTHDGIKWEAQ